MAGAIGRKDRKMDKARTPATGERGGAAVLQVVECGSGLAAQAEAGISD